MDGSVNNICDVTTGECTCNENIIGEVFCDAPADGWWNFPTPEACGCHINCFEEDTDYEGDDLSDNVIENVANANACQLLCHNRADCLFWTYLDINLTHDWAGRCWLKDGKGTIKNEDHEGYTSGPKYCISDVNVEWSK